MLLEMVDGCSVKMTNENMELAVNSILITQELVCNVLADDLMFFFTFDADNTCSISEAEVMRYIEFCHDILANAYISWFDHWERHIFRLTMTLLWHR